MPWVRLDDSFADHPKIERAGPLAAWLHVAALCYCARHLTDGRIPRSKATRLADIPDASSQVLALIREGVWYEDGDDYVIHDYLEYQPSRQQVMTDRGIARRRSAMNTDPELRAALKARDGNLCRYCGKRVNWRDRKGQDGATYDHVIPVSAGGTESVDNLVVACRDCNLRKGSRTLQDAGMTLLPAPSNPNRDQDRIKHGSRQESRPPSRPHPPNTNNSSSSDSRPNPQPVDDDDVPAEVWTHVAELKLALEPAGSVRSPTPWKRKCATNARTELAEQAGRWWHMFDLTPYRLAQALVDGQAPRNIARRQEPA